MQVISF